MSVTPYQTVSEAKKEQVERMFDKIAPKYDLLNRVLSLGIDQTWRRKALGYLMPDQPRHLLDVATGTADVAIMAAKILQPTRIIGIDIANHMLDFGRKKIQKEGLEGIISLETGDSENLQFPDASFDAVTVAFGVRNFENLEKGLAEKAVGRSRLASDSVRGSRCRCQKDDIHAARTTGRLGNMGAGHPGPDSAA